MFKITIISVNGMTWKVGVCTLIISLIIPNYTGQVFKMSVMFETQINLQILAYMYILFIYMDLKCIYPHTSNVGGPDCVQVFCSIHTNL